MVTRPTSRLQAIALNYQSGTAPELVQLVPAGPDVVGRDGRSWRMTAPETVVAAWNGSKEPQIDIEHASELKAPKGEPAPAVGWIKGLEVRDGAIWGRVEWTAAGADLVTNRAYRYLSPVFVFDRDTREVLRIVSAGLTNSPNLEMAALNAAQMETDMDIAVLEALGLSPGASSAQAVVAITRLRDEAATALNAAQHPDPEKWVPRADHQLALNRVAEFETAERGRREAEITAAVDAAVADGKVAPMSRDYHLASCRADGGLERFRTMIAAAPMIAPKGHQKQPDDAAPRLSDEELAVCRQLQIAPEEFAKAKKE